MPFRQPPRAIFLATAIGVLLSSALASAQDAAPAPAPVFVRPTPLVQEGRFMPGTGNEGMIRARYTVKADGSTGDIEIVDGFTNPFYENMIKENIAKWTFTPGTVNGEARDFLNQEHIFRIKVAEGLAISPAVATTMESVNTLISAKDFNKARETINGAFANDVHSVFDYALMNQMLATVHMGLEDPFAALVTIRKATGSSLNAAEEPEYLLTPDILEGALKQHLMLAAALRKQDEVTRTWSVIDDLYDVAPGGEMQQLVSAAEQQLASPDPLVSLGKVVDGSWTHVPTRRIFTVADVRDGTLEKIIARCERRTLELEYQPEVDWNLPAGVGACTLELSGSDNTLFTIYEFAE
jgi:hypothetical protein